MPRTPLALEYRKKNELNEVEGGGTVMQEIMGVRGQRDSFASVVLKNEKAKYTPHNHSTKITKPKL